MTSGLVLAVRLFGGLLVLWGLAPIVFSLAEGESAGRVAIAFAGGLLVMAGGVLLAVRAPRYAGEHGTPDRGTMLLIGQVGALVVAGFVVLSRA